jgi:hypothetical protein
LRNALRRARFLADCNRRKAACLNKLAHLGCGTASAIHGELAQEVPLRLAIVSLFCAAAGSAEAAAHAPPPATPAEPFAFADFTWLNGNPRTTESPLDFKAFTGEFRADSSYIYHFAHPVDHTLSGTSESGRTDEFQLQQLGIGGDFHYQNVRGRLMTQFGMYSTMTPRNDASPTVGQWDLANAYRYLSEAYGGYHFNVWNGINVDAGIFMSSPIRGDISCSCRPSMAPPRPRHPIHPISPTIPATISKPGTIPSRSTGCPPSS